MNIDYTNCDAISSALSKERSNDIVYKIINHFLSHKETLSSDYVDLKTDTKDENELIEFLCNTKDSEQLLFWNNIPDNGLMIGVNLIKNGGIVFSVTSNADGITEKNILNELMNLLQTDIGFISYNQYPYFQTEQEYIELTNRCT